MSTVGQIEKKTQQRVVKLFQQQLGYDYLGDWAERPNNANIEAELLRGWLIDQGVEANLASRAIFDLNKAANDASKGLYDRNKAVYELLRYGVKIKPEVGENTQTVWLIDWKQPERNNFAIAEEVTVKGPDAKAYSKRPDIVLYVNGIALGVLELKRSKVAVNEGIYKTQAPYRLVHYCALVATTLAVQGSIDVEKPRGGVVPVSIMNLIAASSGERKSTVDSIYLRAIRAFDEKEREPVQKWRVFEY